VKHSAQEVREDVEQGVSTSERAENSLQSWAASTVSGPTGHLDKLSNKLNYESVARSRAISKF